MHKILIVDDEKDLATTIEAILSLSGYEAMSVIDGESAIDEVKNNHYDLILMDVKLPVMNGVEAFLKIKEIDPKTKVMMMTGYSVEDLIDQALNEGACGFLRKPFDVERLLETVKEAI